MSEKFSAFVIFGYRSSLYAAILVVDPEFTNDISSFSVCKSNSHTTSQTLNTEGSLPEESLATSQFN